MKKISKKDIVRFLVSSVDKNDENCGKQNIFDDNNDTYWKSNEGKQQWILIELKEVCCILAFNIQFQGGFVGQNCKIEIKKEDEITLEEFYPEDVNSVQSFSLSKPTFGSVIKLTFEGSTDFFGRMVIYSLEIFCEELPRNLD